MAPLSGTRVLAPPRVLLLKNPMFWLILWLQSVASWRYKIILVVKGKCIMDISAYFLCLNNVACCVLPMLELPGPKDF